MQEQQTVRFTIEHPLFNATLESGHPQVLAMLDQLGTLLVK